MNNSQMASTNSTININTSTSTIINTSTNTITSTSTIAYRIKLLPMLEAVGKMYVADRDDGPGTNGTTLY